MEPFVLLFLLVLTVLAVVVLTALAGVAVRRAGLLHTVGHVLTWVQLASVHTIFPKKAWRQGERERQRILFVALTLTQSLM